MKTIATVIVALAITAGAALAAAPRPSGLYIGTIAGTEKRLEIHVAPDGKTATAAMFCSKTKVGALPRFSVTGTRFKASNHVGSTLVWAIAGRFTSSQQARVSIALHSLCDGKGGLATLSLRSN
jgi:hypothetical protein